MKPLGLNWCRIFNLEYLGGKGGNDYQCFHLAPDELWHCYCTRVVRVGHARANTDFEEVVRPLEQIDMHTDNSAGCFLQVNVYYHITRLFLASPS